ncbi:uncharacterized protein LOC133824521 [Humulus lupulus]|uniref:uncharacterized protein LOC133824521 n=1 Tax=Humulus lupulus TaxID=3486 RepID=UPI002B41522D|nr:uncharacterized protein LOC133824521 [Humulus lupulus]
MRFDARQKGSRICLETTKGVRAALPDPWLGISSGCFRSKDWRHYMYEEKCEINTGHKSLKYFFMKKELNMRQQRWIELVKEYYSEILYHPGKANVVANALSIWSCRKISTLKGIAQHLHDDIKKSGIELITGQLADLPIKSALMEEIKEKQQEDKFLLKKKATLQTSENAAFSLTKEGIL